MKAASREKICKSYNVSKELHSWMIDIRRYLHAHPELSYQEKLTSLFIQNRLNEIAVPFTSGHAGTGVIAEIAGRKGGREAVVGLRADMDGLPIHEESSLSYASTIPGVMHACGHDGHTAMLLGAAALLGKNDFPGSVRCIFQPAEEHGNGAEKLVSEGVIDGVQAIFAGHIDTLIPTGIISVDAGVVCAWADPFQITLKGRSGHAARPHLAVDAVVAAANLVMTLQTLVSRGVDPNKAAVVTVGMLEAGTAQNIIPQKAVLRGTVRSTHEYTRNTTLEGLQRVVDSTARMYGVESELIFKDRIPAVKNDTNCVAVAKKAALSTHGIKEVGSQGVASLGAEDFAFYQQKIPGCMVRFGAAVNPPVGVSHSGSFNFDENVLAIGASWYATVAHNWLYENCQ